MNCFVAVAQELNFSQAAQPLNMMQPSLTRQIQILEHQIGVTLLSRSTRSVKFTPAGEAFLVEAQQLLDLASHATQKA
ncbi:LysR family transcriptional regulator [Celerinatantimonas diazotrophica]|uniref:LysR family transcriptional regulator n=1 Tax=Celerinatantimonas diazotrophica TaxID=412034 RepID=UPI001404D5E5|nr:LysR family transcriptional regulator [Celerinatantimonas diazotrophica]